MVRRLDGRAADRVNRLAGASEVEIAAWLAKQVWLPLIVARLVPAVDPEQIVLFGSRALGTARDDSDYDLVVVAPLRRGERRRVRTTAYRALGDLPFTRDIVIATPDEWSRVHRPISMLLEIVTGRVLRIAKTDGFVIYERSRTATHSRSA